MKRVIAGLIISLGLTAAPSIGAAATPATDPPQDQAPTTRPSIFISPYGEPFLSPVSYTHLTLPTKRIV